MKMVHVHTTATAVVSETWVLEVADDVNVAALQWTGGWDEAIATGKARKVGRTEDDITQHRNRKVVEVRTR